MEWLAAAFRSTRIVLRLLRLLRVLKLLKQLRQLQIIVSGLIDGLKDIGYVLVLMLIVFYFFGVIGVLYFGKNDPKHFSGLDTAFVTLFRVRPPCSARLPRPAAWKYPA